MSSKTTYRFTSCFLFFFLIVHSNSIADNPLISQRYTADPSGFVYNERVYVFCSSDEENGNGYNLLNYTLISSDDMVNWTDHGLVFKVKKVTSWASQAYAPTACVRYGKIWLYFPNGATSIGVAVADKPEGPYKDALGKPLITKSMPNCNVGWLFDPCIFVDSTKNGTQAYLTFGGGENSSAPYGKNLRIIKINDDMISVSGTAVTVNAPNSFEGPFIHKYNNKYYFSYPTTGASKIDYLMSDNPMNNYSYKGTFLENPTLNGKNINLHNNSHGGPVLYNNQWYMFYHDRRLSNKAYKRNASVDLLYYNNDGTIKKVIVTSEGPPQLKKLNPYTTIQAETIWKQKGIETDFCNEGGAMLTQIAQGDYTSLKGVNFSDGAQTLEVRAASASGGGTIEVRLGDENGTLAGSCTISGTGGWTSWKTFTCNLTNCNGVKNVYFVYKGSGEPFRINWFKFNPVTVGIRTKENPVIMPDTKNTILTTLLTSNKQLSPGTVFNVAGRKVAGTHNTSFSENVATAGIFIVKPDIK